MTEFYKYQGTGNDFIMVDNRMLDEPEFSAETRSLLCHRRFGIGADGIIFLQNHTEADFEMRYYNADGQLGSMCGNGARCAVAFAHFLGIINDSCHFIAYDGTHRAHIQDDNYTVQLKVAMHIELLQENHYFVDTGSPHYVQWLDRESLQNLDVVQAGKAIRYSEKYKEKGTNVNFVAATESGIFVRTYERGVEDETLSCGTGVTAAALVCWHRNPDILPEISIETLGGKLKVFLGEEIMLSGPAKQVYQGFIKL